MSALSGLGAGAVGGNSFGSVMQSVGSGAQGQSTSQPVVIPQMMDLYNQSLALNQSNYNNILGAYTGGQNRLAASLPGIYQGYGNIQGEVQNTLGMGGTGWGVATPAAQAIAQNFAATQGRTQQDLINRGLGNSSVLAGASNQNALMAGQAFGGLGAQLAQTYAGYQAQLGLAQQAAQMQGLGMQTGLSQAEGSTLGGYHFQAPSQLLGQVSQSTQQSNQPRYNTSGGIMGGGPRGGGYGTPLGSDNSTGGYSSYTQGSGGGSGYNPFNPGPGKGRVSDYGGPSGFASSVGDPGSGFRYGPSGGIQDPSDVDLSEINLSQDFA